MTLVMFLVLKNEFSMILCAANMTKWYWNAVGGSVLDGVESDKSFQVNLFDSTLCDFCDTIENRTQIFHRRDAKNNSPCRIFINSCCKRVLQGIVRAAKRCSLTRPSHTRDTESRSCGGRRRVRGSARSRMWSLPKMTDEVSCQVLGHGTVTGTVPR